MSRRGMPRFPVAEGGGSVGVSGSACEEEEQRALALAQLWRAAFTGRARIGPHRASNNNSENNHTTQANYPHSTPEMLSALRRSTRARVPKVSVRSLVGCRCAPGADSLLGATTAQVASPVASQRRNLSIHEYMSMNILNEVRHSLNCALSYGRDAARAAGELSPESGRSSTSGILTSELVVVVCSTVCRHPSPRLLTLPRRRSRSQRTLVRRSPTRSLINRLNTN